MLRTNYTKDNLDNAILCILPDYNLFVYNKIVCKHLTPFAIMFANLMSVHRISWRINHSVAGQLSCITINIIVSTI